MGSGGHGPLKVSPCPVMPYPSIPCGRATLDIALQPFQGWPTYKASGLWLSSAPVDTLHCTPMYSYQIDNVSFPCFPKIEIKNIVLLKLPPRDMHCICIMQTSKLLSAMRGGIVVCIWSKLESHILKSVKDRLWSLFRAWVPAGHRSGIGQMKDISRISLVCSFATFQARNDPVWFSPRLVMWHIDGVTTVESLESPQRCPPPPRKKEVGQYFCIDIMLIFPVVLVFVW
jgi:hypothetical protein